MTASGLATEGISPQRTSTETASSADRALSE